MIIAISRQKSAQSCPKCVLRADMLGLSTLPVVPLKHTMRTLRLSAIEVDVRRLVSLRFSSMSWSRCILPWHLKTLGKTRTGCCSVVLDGLDAYSTSLATLLPVSAWLVRGCRIDMDALAAI